MNLTILDHSTMATMAMGLDEFSEANADDASLVAEVAGLAPGASLKVGGGAAPLFTVQRVR